MNTSVSLTTINIQAILPPEKGVKVSRCQVLTKDIKCFSNKVISLFSVLSIVISMPIRFAPKEHPANYLAAE